MTKEEINEEACEHCNWAMCSVCENRTCDNTHLATLKCREWRDRRAGYYCGAESREKHIAELEKENAELEKENAELNKKLSEAEADYDKMFWNKNEIISKAKEIIKMLHSDCYSIAECEDTNLGLWEDDLAKAEQFLNNEVEK